MPNEFPEDPVEAFRRCVYVARSGRTTSRWLKAVRHRPRDLRSDWLHPEGLADPINLVDDLVAHGLDDEGVKR